MPYIQPETLKEIKKLDLLTYLRNYEPDELIHVSGKEYTTRTHDSLRISNGLWNWCSRGIGGKTALDYLIKVRGFSFMEAFMDELEVISKPHVGTLVKMRKTIGEGRKLWTIQSY